MITAEDLCKRFEGYRPTPYLCPAGVWTIGYGTTRYPDGARVSGTDPAITEEQAAEYLSQELLAIKLQLLRSCASLKDKPQKLEAVADWVYNLGMGKLLASTMWKHLKDSRWESAAIECQKWVYGGGKVLPGLVRRRMAESILIRGAVP